MASVNVLVSVSSDYLNRMPELVEKLQCVGMTNIQSMEAVGVITGSLDEDNVADLCSIEGVEQVERSQQSQIAPPDSPIQ
jgi:hypothetical protein